MYWKTRECRRKRGNVETSEKVTFFREKLDFSKKKKTKNVRKGYFRGAISKS